MSYQQEFINKIVPYAQKSQKMYGVFASVTISQACWESAYGTYKGAVVQQDHNLFGIKYAGNHCPDIKVTKGSKVGDGAGYYCHYENIGDSCIDHGYFLKHNSRYTQSGTFNAKNGKDQLKCIMNAGYAESAYYDGACKIIDTYNLYQYDNVVDNSKIIESACNWAVKIANDDTHGYDQTNRWGTPDYDCSSLVISAYEQAGIKVKEAGATYTGNMKSAFLKCGFKVVGLDNLQRGDVLLNEVHHTALFLGNGKMVQASITENGVVTGGQPGDQTGREIWVAPYKNYPWDFALRLEGGSTGGGGGGDTPGDNYVSLKSMLWYDGITRISCYENKFKLITTHGNVVQIQNILNLRHYFVKKSNILYNK